ncbi:type III pantothenate kinase [Mangrovimonas sp. AS39]|uniref:type III pantothenate kinase n=1 Tax=Mangrovimonas futianensis TaxID=2895523 RepID=UPI001E2FB2C1|nr:type III pantothenate kinase [Mangrovimonas futianensis]MCF1190867.1 type III pantothenate kinase [Mangrovimonas futianensis]MCF1194563.1 type III pantothenate kinase [Mangrovimonas futianensis]
MNLVVDVGNTLIKMAVFQEGGLMSKVSAPVQEFQQLFFDLLSKYSIKHCLVSSVGKLNEENRDLLNEHLNCLFLDHTTLVPFKNRYATPQTLGVDRIALVSASVAQFPDSNVLIIDAGTCITYDFINENNEYLGGAISPGLQMRYKSMHNQTASLPLLEMEEPQSFFGDSTNSSMHVGVVLGIVNEIDGFVKEYQTNYKDLTVILTGGDSKILCKRLKSGIFANSNFLLEGLNNILEYNTSE